MLRRKQKLRFSASEAISLYYFRNKFLLCNYLTAERYNVTTKSWKTLLLTAILPGTNFSEWNDKRYKLQQFRWQQNKIFKTLLPSKFFLLILRYPKNWRGTALQECITYSAQEKTTKGFLEDRFGKERKM